MITANINDKVFSHRPIQELFAVVRNDFSTLDEEGLVDDGKLIKVVQYCNERLGISIKEVREIAIPVENYKAKLPLDFEKLYYTCALEATSSGVAPYTPSVTGTIVNPFDNQVDADIIFEAKLDRESLGCVENYQVIVNRVQNTTIHQFGSWVTLDVVNSEPYCHIDCPNRRKKGRYSVAIVDGHIECPFRRGTLYIMYIGMMKDAEGNLTFPFHPLITPYYEWTIKEKILSDAIFNSDAPNIAEKFKLAQQERSKAYLDAWDFTTSKSYGEYAKMQRKKELQWYHQWFRYFQ